MLYRSNKFPYVFLHETKESLTKFRLPAADHVSRTPEYLTAFGESLGAKVVLSKPKDLIFVISKEKFMADGMPFLYANGGKEIQLWNVLIGERTGWIFIPDWLELEEVNE
jgi:hypothetical protein